MAISEVVSRTSYIKRNGSKAVRVMTKTKVTTRFQTIVNQISDIQISHGCFVSIRCLIQLFGM